MTPLTVINDSEFVCRWIPSIDKPGYFFPGNGYTYGFFWAMTDAGILTEIRPVRPVSIEEITSWAEQLLVYGD